MYNVITKENKTIGEKYNKVSHSSGLDIYVFPKDLTSSYAVFATKYGSVDNKFRVVGKGDFIRVPDGIAHFLEHKMFENEDGEDTFKKYARTGANANAYTSFLRTAYLFSATDNFPESLEILLSTVCAPYFTEENVKKEQGIIAQEIKMYEDSPSDALFYGVLGAMYKDHYVRTKIAGSVDSIMQITPEILYKCYETFYNLHNMVLCVSGRVTVDEVIKVADKVLKPAPDETIESVCAKEQEEVYETTKVIKKQVAMPMVAIGIKDVKISEDPAERLKKKATMAILCEALFSAGSELPTTLYEEGVTADLLSYYFDHNQSFSHILLFSESKTPTVVFDRFREYMKRVKEDGSLTEEVTNRCKKVVYASFLKTFNSTDNVCNDFLDFVFENQDILDYSDVIASVTHEDVINLINELFVESHYALSIVEPIE